MAARSRWKSTGGRAVCEIRNPALAPGGAGPRPPGQTYAETYCAEAGAVGGKSLRSAPVGAVERCGQSAEVAGGSVADYLPGERGAEDRLRGDDRAPRAGLQAHIGVEGIRPLRRCAPARQI